MVRILESTIQENFRTMMWGRGWYTKPTHGSAYQKGFPDVWCVHLEYEYRWVDCKVEGRYEFTKAQIREWPIWEAFGIGIWIATGWGDRDYKKLFRPPNWRDYWKQKYGSIPTKKQIMETLREEMEHDAEPVVMEAINKIQNPVDDMFDELTQ